MDIMNRLRAKLADLIKPKMVNAGKPVDEQIINAGDVYVVLVRDKKTGDPVHVFYTRDPNAVV